MKLILSVLLGIGFTFTHSWAAATTVDLSKDIPTGLEFSLFDATADKKVKSLPPLALLKYSEIRLKAADCDRLAPGLYAKHKELRGWIALSWLRCGGKKPSEAALVKIGQSPELFDRGPWKQSLWALWSEQSLASVDAAMKKKSPGTEKKISQLLGYSEKLTKDDRATLFRYLGELSQQKKDYPRGLFYFEESMGLKETPSLQEKIRFLRKALNIPLGDKVSDKIAAGPADDKNLASPEQQIEDRMAATLRAGESIAAIKDAVEILNGYPGSRVAKRLKDKPLEIYNSLFDRGSQIESSVLEKALDEMCDVDANRLVDWAQALHRRADYKGALYLAEKAWPKLYASTSSTSLLWIAGRSAHFTGQYDKAIKYFDELSLKHRGTDEASEALFRTGLIQFRLKNDSTAVVLFDKVLAEKKERYDLLARYWLYRGLERSKNERAAAVRADLINLYPFSYYGIRLRAEMNNSQVNWPAVVEKEESKQSSIIFLEANQAESWKRFADLVKAGWVSEAQAELQDFPALQNPRAQTLLGQRLAKAGLSSLAIRLIGDAMDQDNSLRKKEVLSESFPQNFKDTYEKEAERNEVNSRLLMSLTRQESAFNPRATSTSNAMGLMQLIPPTAREVAQKLGYKKIEIPEDLFRPEVNIAMGSFYITDMLKQFNYSVPFALAAYNAGPSRMSLWIAARDEVQNQVASPSSNPADEIWFDELPWTETSFYVKAILRNTLIYKLIGGGEFDLGPVVWSDLVLKKAPTK